METQDHDSSALREKLVNTALIEQSYHQLPIAIAVNLISGAGVTLVLWGGAQRPVLFIWLLALLSVTAVRYAVLRAFRDGERRAQVDDATWRRNFVLGACASGVVWGAAGVLLFQLDSFTAQVFLAFVLGGLVAGAIPLLSSLDRAFQCFAIPTALPIGVKLLSVGDSTHATMGLMVLVFGGAMLVSSARVRKLFHDAADLRFKLACSMEVARTLREMLRRDELTGIANRRYFEEMLASEWNRARREKAVLSLITADIDYFKAYNDHFGHPAGDRCLVRVARAMADVMHRPGDLAARVGGEEFAFLLPGTTLEGAVHVAEQIRKRVLELRLPREAPHVSAWVTVSLGVACADHASFDSAADLLRASDVALYEAKRRGRNQVAFTPPTEIDGTARRNLPGKTANQLGEGTPKGQACGAAAMKKALHNGRA